MRDFILRLKSWQVFVCLLTPRMSAWLVRDELLGTALNFIGWCLWVFWVAFLVSSLSRVRAAVSGYNFNWFIGNVTVVLLAGGYGAFAGDPNAQFSSTSFRVKGVLALPGLYAGFAYVHLHWFTASLLLAKEQGRRPDFSQVILIFLGLWFWPIGVWLVQEKANKILIDDDWERQALSELGNKNETVTE